MKILFLVFILFTFPHAQGQCLDVISCLKAFEFLNEPTPDCIEDVPLADKEQRFSASGTIEMFSTADVKKVTGLDVIDPPKENVQKDPVWWKITLFGLALAPVEFFVSTTIHEGSHAATVKMMGGNIIYFKPYPHHDSLDRFRFGAVSWAGGVLSKDEVALALAAPMFVDTAVLVSYGGLVLTGNLPRNKYAQTGVLVFAAGHWVDLATHFISSRPSTDSKKLKDFYIKEKGWSENKATAVIRGSQAAVLMAGGYFLYKGGRKLFGHEKKKNPKKIKHDLHLSEDSNLVRQKIDKMDLMIAPNLDEGAMGISFSGNF